MNSDKETPGSGIVPAAPNIIPWTVPEQLQAAMQITDTIRLQEQKQVGESTESKPKSSSDSDSSFDPLEPLRKFLEVPGVAPGCIAAGFGIALMIPVRRSLLRVCDKYWNLGKAFPDLIITPMITIYVAQCSLWIGSLYGCSFYLNKLASFPTEAPSNTVDTICRDPIIMDASLRIPRIGAKALLLQDQRQGSYMATSFGQLDPREKVLSTLQDAVRSCEKRRDFVKSNGKNDR